MLKDTPSNKVKIVRTSLEMEFRSDGPWTRCDMCGKPLNRKEFFTLNNLFLPSARHVIWVCSKPCAYGGILAHGTVK